MKRDHTGKTEASTRDSREEAAETISSSNTRKAARRGHREEPAVDSMETEGREASMESHKIGNNKRKRNHSRYSINSRVKELTDQPSQIPVRSSTKLMSNSLRST